MRITLKEIWATNFRSYKDLHLKDMNKLGLVLVTGPNGSGKSAIRNIIEMLLIDTTAEKIPLSDITFNQKGDCEIGGIFEQDGRVIKIVKYRDHKTEGNRILLEIDGDDSITSNDRRKTQKEIETLFGVDKNRLFGSTVFTKHALSFPEASEPDRKDVLYKFLSLQRFTDRNKKAKEKVADLDKLLSKIDIPNLRSKLLESEVELDVLSDKQRNWEVNRKQSIKDIEAYETCIKSTVVEQLEYEELKSKLVLLNEDEYDNLIECRRAADKLISLRKQIVEIPKNPVELYEKIDSLDKELLLQDSLQSEKVCVESKIVPLKQESISIQSEILKAAKEIESIGNGLCPITGEDCSTISDRTYTIKCGFQETLDAFNEKQTIIGRKLSKLRAKRVSIDTELKRLYGVSVEVKTLEKELYKTCQYIGDSKQHNKTTESEIESVLLFLNDNCHYQSVEDIETRLSSLRETKKINDSILQSIAEVKERIKVIERENLYQQKRAADLESQLSKLKSETNPFDGLHDAKKSSIKEQELNIENKEYEFGSIEEERRMYDFWVGGFSPAGVPNLIIEGYLDEIESLINDNLKRLYPGTVVRLSATTDLKSGDTREKISYKVITPDSSRTTYESYSEGERQRVKIADLFSFSELLNPFNFMFLDEMLETALDDGGIDEIVKFIKNKAFNMGSIFVVSHISNTKNKFDKVIEVEKVKGISNLKFVGRQ